MTGVRTIPITEGRCPLCRQPVSDDIGLNYDPSSQVVICGKRALRLTLIEGGIFQQLFENPRKVLSCEDLAFGVYGNVLEADRPEDPEGVVRQLIWSIRSKLKGANLPVSIATVRGRGFVFLPDD